MGSLADQVHLAANKPIGCLRGGTGAGASRNDHGDFSGDGLDHRRPLLGNMTGAKPGDYQAVITERKDVFHNQRVSGQ
ncbi:hypothetical protein D3C75_1264020 [compost metagenome]